MNRGSALKWIEQIKLAMVNPQIKFDSSQLCYEHNGIRYMDHFGVLCDFLDPNGWKYEPSLGWYSWHGNAFFINEEYRKKCKVKTENFEFVYSDNEVSNKKTSLADIIWNSISFQRGLNVIEKYYEQF